jgi:uncharacterized OsmC-like protein
VDGVIRVTAIRVHYRAAIPPGSREKAERALKVYAEKCPAYMTVRNCLSVTSTAELKETPDRPEREGP